MISVRHLAFVCAASWGLAVSAVVAQSSAVLTTDIPPQPLPQALAMFAKQTGLQLIYVSDIVRDQQSPGATAGAPAADALGQLLAGTGLRFEFLNARTVRLYVPNKTGPSEIINSINYYFGLPGLIRDWTAV